MEPTLTPPAGGRNARAVSPLMRGMVEAFLDDAGRLRLWTKGDQAAAIGMPIGTYRKLLRGEHAIDVDEAERIAACMGIDAAELVRRARAKI